MITCLECCLWLNEQLKQTKAHSHLAYVSGYCASTWHTAQESPWPGAVCDMLKAVNEAPTTAMTLGVLDTNLSVLGLQAGWHLKCSFLLACSVGYRDENDHDLIITPGDCKNTDYDIIDALNGQAWSSASPRGQWRTGENGGNWLWNHPWCPNGPRGKGIDDEMMMMVMTIMMMMMRCF